MRWYFRFPLLTSVFVLLWFLGVHGSQRIMPRIDVEMSLTFSPEPEVGEEFTVTLTFTPREEIPHANELDDAAQIGLDPGVELVSGMPWWEGRWVKGKTETFHLVVKVTEPGHYRFSGIVRSCRSDPRRWRKLLGIRPEMAEISEKIFRFRNVASHTLCIGKPELHTGEEIWSIDASTGEAKRIRVDVPSVPPLLSPEKAVVRDAEAPWNGINAEAETQEETATGDKYVPDDLRNKIVFVCSEGICTINGDGTDLKIIVRSDAGSPFSDVRWSPDKRRIGFTGHVEGQQRIFLTASDGSHRRIIKPPEELLRHRPQKCRLEFIGWSPSGDYILYRFRAFHKVHYGLMTVKGKFVTVLGGGPASFGRSDEVTYVVYHGGQWTTGADIFTYNLKTKEKRNLTNTGGDTWGEDYQPSFSPDGRQIAYTYSGSPEDRTDPPFRYDLWIMNSDGSGKRKLAISGEDFEGSRLNSVQFSPDAQKIMFVDGEEGKSRIYIVDKEGTGLRAITDRIALAVGGASWSPDGTQIVFTSGKDDNDDLYVVNIDGTGLRRLTENTTMDCCPDW